LLVTFAPVRKRFAFVAGKTAGASKKQTPGEFAPGAFG